jgi:hypothetical protein
MCVAVSASLAFTYRTKSLVLRWVTLQRWYSQKSFNQVDHQIASLESP